MQRIITKQPTPTAGDAGLKRNKTSENTQRQSVIHSRGGTHSHIQQLVQSSIHTKSKNSDIEMNSSIGAS